MIESYFKSSERINYIDSERYEHSDIDTSILQIYYRICAYEISQKPIDYR